MVHENNNNDDNNNVMSDSNSEGKEGERRFFEQEIDVNFKMTIETTLNTKVVEIMKNLQASFEVMQIKSWSRLNKKKQQRKN